MRKRNNFVLVGVPYILDFYSFQVYSEHFLKIIFKFYIEVHTRYKSRIQMCAYTHITIAQITISDILFSLSPVCSVFEFCSFVFQFAHVNEIMVLVCLTYFTQHPQVCLSMSQMARFPHFLLLIYILLCFYPLINGHLSCFHASAIVNNTDITGMHLSFHISDVAFFR